MGSDATKIKLLRPGPELESDNVILPNFKCTAVLQAARGPLMICVDQTIK